MWCLKAGSKSWVVARHHAVRAPLCRLLAPPSSWRPLSSGTTEAVSNVVTAVPVQTAAGAQLLEHALQASASAPAAAVKAAPTAASEKSVLKAMRKSETHTEALQVLAQARKSGTQMSMSLYYAMMEIVFAAKQWQQVVHIMDGAVISKQKPDAAAYKLSLQASATLGDVDKAIATAEAALHNGVQLPADVLGGLLGNMSTLETYKKSVRRAREPDKKGRLSLVAQVHAVRSALQQRMPDIACQLLDELKGAVPSTDPSVRDYVEHAYRHIIGLKLRSQKYSDAAALLKEVSHKFSDTSGASSSCVIVSRAMALPVCKACAMLLPDSRADAEHRATPFFFSFPVQHVLVAQLTSSSVNVLCKQEQCLRRVVAC
jgi:hypothetical protein